MQNISMSNLVITLLESTTKSTYEDEMLGNKR